MTDNPATTACAHQWHLYDVYHVNPHFGNLRCEKCGERRKGESISDEQVVAYMKSSEAALLELRIVAATQAVTDECGSRLCKWVDGGTKRVCWKDDGHSICLCENVARAVLAADDGVKS